MAESPGLFSDDFFEYKQRILKESQKSFDSTSADSKRLKSENRSEKEDEVPNENDTQIVSKQDTIDNNLSQINFAKTWS